MHETLTTKPFKCRRCGHEIGKTDGTDIWFGVQKVPYEPRRILMQCPKCKAPLEWIGSRYEKKPLRKPQDVVGS